jgi:translation initiation factor 2A
MHFKREDEGGAAHVVSNGTALVNTNGFGRPRRQVPGAETVESAPPGAAPAVPGAAVTEGDENLSKAALKNKKKREAKRAKDAEGKPAGGLAAPEANNGMNDNRSPERRNDRGHGRSRSKGGDASFNTPRATPSHPPGFARPNGGHTGAGGNLAIKSQPNPIPAAEAPELSITSPGGGSPGAKKLRGLQKKIRAIEDLEMRLAGGEKLEDTQMKKIATKVTVQAELDVLEKE